MRPFHRVVDASLAATIMDTVFTGITKADVVFALFTPDEHSALYDPSTGKYKPKKKSEEQAGWQPRPNVIFEAGLAVGVARKKTALVRLGDLRRISDLDGVRYIDLDEPNAKEQLLQFIRRCVPSVQPSLESTASLPGDFSKFSRARWDYHDELGQLEEQLRSITVEGSRNTTFYDVIVDYAVAHSYAGDWNSTELVDFFLQRVRPAVRPLDVTRPGAPSEDFRNRKVIWQST